MVKQLKWEKTTLSFSIGENHWKQLFFYFLSHHISSRHAVWRDERKVMGCISFERLSQQPICCYLLITYGVLEDNLRNLFIEANRWFCKKLYHEKMWRDGSNIVRFLTWFFLISFLPYDIPSLKGIYSNSISCLA